MNKKRILIVDDQGELRKLIRMTLEFEDYELHEANSGTRAIELVASVQPDILILDVMMPGELDGFAVCEKIKSEDETRSIYILLLTARGQDTDIKRGEEAGADAYLIKPFSPLELIEIVKKALQ